jgi:V/A-type H+-transporting ATPase subunit K
MHGKNGGMKKMREMKLVRMGMRMLLVLSGLTLLAGVASALTEGELAEKDTMAKLGAGIALGGCGIGTGLGQGQIGAAAVGWVAEDGSKIGLALMFTVLPETILMFGFIGMFLL